MSHLGCPDLEYIVFEVESPKHERRYQDFYVNVALHEIFLADKKVQFNIVDGVAMVMKSLAEMVELATVTKRALILPLDPPLNLVTM